MASRAPLPSLTCVIVSIVTFPSPQAKNASTHSRRASFEEDRAGAGAAAGLGAAVCTAAGEAGDAASHPRAAATRTTTRAVTRVFMRRRLTSFAFLFEAHENIARRDGLPGGALDRRDHAVPRRLDLVLHLHRLEHENRLTLGHAVARRDEDAQDPARHGRGDVPDLLHGAPARRQQRARRELVQELEPEEGSLRRGAHRTVLLESDADLDLAAVPAHQRPHAVAHLEGVSRQNGVLERGLELGRAGRHDDRAALALAGHPHLEFHSRTPKDARAFRHAEYPASPPVGAAPGRRFFAPSIDPRAAAITEAATTSSGGRVGSYFQSSRNCVDTRFAMTSGSSRSDRKNGIDVSMPSTRASERARRIRRKASSRSWPHTMNFATIGS